jgi:lysine 6-dehydrogenase
MTDHASYLVLGAGAQGTAAAHDLLRFQSGSTVLLADASPAAARAAAARLRALSPDAAKRVSAAGVDGRSAAALRRLMKGRDAVLSALPYYLNPGAAAAAVAEGVPYADLGGHFETTQKIQKLDGKARKAKVAVLPDLGISPGTCNILAAAGISRMDRTEEVHIFCGGLPQEPRPPLQYKLVFNLEGVIGNYLGKAYVLRDGEIREDEPLSRRQTLEVAGVGTLEVAVTGGATATAPWTWRGKVRTYDYKTLRYPGHWDKIETLRALGLLEETPVTVAGRPVVPRDVFVACAEDKLKFPDDRDLLVQRVVVVGDKDGRPARRTFDLLDKADPATGFTAMQRTTGFSAAIILAMLADGTIAGPGVLSVETAVPADAFIKELRRRGIDLKEAAEPSL